MKMASRKPVTSAPASSPPRARTEMNPTTRGKATASAPGMSISRNAEAVEMSTHLAYSARTPSLPSRSPGISRNWRRTSSIIWLAARPTAWIVSAAKRNGNIPPRKSPTVTWMSRMSSVASSPPASTTAWRNVKNSASAVTAAEPIAKPLATAAVVLPSESSASVASRTSGGRWAISAMPPALSAIGP